MDRLELMQMLLGHPETDLRVDLGGFLLDVRDVRYSAEREAIVLLLYPEDVRDVLRCPFRERAPDERTNGPNGSSDTRRHGPERAGRATEQARSSQG